MAFKHVSRATYIDSFDIDRAALLTGHSRRAIDHLCRERIITPSNTKRRGRGQPRLFSFSDLIALRVLRQLIDLGVSPRKINKTLRAAVRRLQIEPAGALTRFMVLQGNEIVFREASHILDPLTGQYLFAFVIDLHRSREEIERAIEHRSAR
jgi:DNA-binding transcriptional MerR regulator